jgi:hypothetical protein
MERDANDDELIRPGDTTVIRIGDPYEIRRWCQRLVCTEETLREAVARVGTDPGTVRNAIRKRGLEIGARDSSRQ